MATLAQLESQFDVRMFDWLVKDAEAPKVTTAACQGDVSVLAVTTGAATTRLPAAGFPVVRGEGGNTHSLHGDVFFDPASVSGDSLVLGTLTVPDGREGYLLHPEHGALAVQPGTYRIGRQREYAGAWRKIAD